MASEPKSGYVDSSAERPTGLARTLLVSGWLKAQLMRTAVYGTVRTVLWKGRMGDCPPYPYPEVRPTN